MAFITAAIIGGGASLLGGVAGGVMQSNSASHAADLQAQAAAQANQLQGQMFEEQRSDQAPWRQAGAQALSQMQDPYFQKSFDPSTVTSDPGYAFRLQQGQQALERSAAARGGLQSGGTLKGLTQYAQDYASNEFQNAYNRFGNDQTNRFNRLSSLAGLGQTANGMTAQAGQNYASQVGNNTMGAANAAGAASIASGNNWGNTLSSLGSGFGNNWMQATAMSHNPWLNMPTA